MESSAVCVRIKVALDIFITITGYCDIQERLFLLKQILQFNKMKVGKGCTDIPNICIESTNFYRIDAVESINPGHNEYNIVSSERKSEKNYFYIETEYNDSVGHWLFESALFLPFFYSLKTNYPDLILYIPNMKTYKSLFCRFLNVPFTSEFVEGSTTICPEPISCLTSTEDNNQYKVLVDKFWELFTPPPSMIKTPFLVMPRQSKENYRPNDRHIEFKNITKFLGECRTYTSCETDTLTELDAQISAVNAAGTIVLSSGGAYTVNSLFARNKTIYVVGEPDMLAQGSKYPLSQYVINKGRASNTVFFCRSDNDVVRLLQNHIYIFGDSHAQYSFNGLALKHSNLSQSSFTLNRVGRDGVIPNYNPSYDSENSAFVFSFGEVDARCQIHKQLLSGRALDEIINNLVTSYMIAIKKNIIKSKKIIVVAVIPPTRRHDYESRHGPITHEFPFLGTDEERVNYTILLNAELEYNCRQQGFYFFDPYEIYKNVDGTLNFDFSDNLVHIGNGKNSNLLTSFIDLLYKEKLL